MEKRVKESQEDVTKNRLVRRQNLMTGCSRGLMARQKYFQSCYKSEVESTRVCTQDMDPRIAGKWGWSDKKAVDC